MNEDSLRIAVSDVAKVIADPKKYRQELQASSSQPRRFSKMQCLRLACYRYHKPNEDLESAQEYLEAMFLRNFSNTEDLADHTQLLDQYVGEFERTGNTAIHCRERMAIVLPSDISVKVRVTGETSRIDLTDKGFAVWLIGHGFDNWDRDPRFPLLQGHYARKLQAKIHEVSVGVFDFDVGKHESVVFSDSLVRATASKLESALKLGFT